MLLSRLRASGPTACARPAATRSVIVKRLLRPLGVGGLFALLALADPATASAQATTSAPDKASIGASRYIAPKGNITLGANQATVKIEWTWGVVNANGTEGPNLAGNPPPSINVPNVRAWQRANILSVAGQKYWVKAVFTWRDATGNHTNLPVKGEVTLDP